MARSEAVAQETADAARPKASKRLPGRPPKSGSRALSKYIRNNTLDRRTWVAKQYEANADRIAADGGGWGALTNREQALVWLAAGLLLELQVRQSYRLKQLEQGTLKIDDDDRWFGWLYNSFTRVMQLLGVRPDKVERLTPLSEYIATRPSNGNGNASHHDAHGPHSDHDTAQAMAPPTRCNGSPNAPSASGRSTAVQSEPPTAAPQPSPQEPAL